MTSIRRENALHALKHSFPTHSLEECIKLESYIFDEYEKKHLRAQEKACAKVKALDLHNANIHWYIDMIVQTCATKTLLSTPFAIRYGDWATQQNSAVQAEERALQQLKLEDVLRSMPSTTKYTVKAPKPCHSCGGTNAYKVTVQDRGGDEAMSTYFQCINPQCNALYKT